MSVPMLPWVMPLTVRCAASAMNQMEDVTLALPDGDEPPVSVCAARGIFCLLRVHECVAGGSVQLVVEEVPGVGLGAVVRGVVAADPHARGEHFVFVASTLGVGPPSVRGHELQCVVGLSDLAGAAAHATPAPATWQ